jgi:tetratricopeptide (TPR) repeat protein
MRITSCFIAVVLFALVSPAMAAPCTPGQRADLAKSGYGPADIEKMCGSGDNSSGNVSGSALSLFERAYNAKESGDLRSSQQLFEEGLRIEPENALGQKFLAEVKDALSSAQKLFEQGYNAKQSGDLRTAQQLFEQGLRIEPGNALGQKYLAEVKEYSTQPPGKEDVSTGCRVEPLRKDWQNVRYEGDCRDGVAQGIGSYTADFTLKFGVTQFTVNGRFSGGRLNGPCTVGGNRGIATIFVGECRDNEYYKGKLDNAIRTKVGEFYTVNQNTDLWNGIDRANDINYGFHIVDGKPYSHCSGDRINEKNCTAEEREKILGR